MNDHDRDAWRALERALRGAYDGLVGPEWPRIRASFHAGIRPGSRWDGTTLELNVPGEGERTLDGHGLTLLGRTRAAILRALTEPRTTTGLARTLEVSGASASEHARTLRRAGLITTRRTGKAVTHLITPLGLRLLHGE